LQRVPKSRSNVNEEDKAMASMSFSYKEKEKWPLSFPKFLLNPPKGIAKNPYVNMKG